MTEHPVAAWISIAIVVATSIAVISVRFSALEEAKDTYGKALAKHALEMDEIESRVRALEQSKGLEVRVNVMAEDVAFIRSQVQELRDDMRRRGR